MTDACVPRYAVSLAWRGVPSDFSYSAYFSIRAWSGSRSFSSPGEMLSSGRGVWVWLLWMEIFAGFGASQAVGASEDLLSLGIIREGLLPAAAIESSGEELLSTVSGILDRKSVV